MVQVDDSRTHQLAMADNSGYSVEVLKSWAAAYNACYQLYKDKKLEECIVLVEHHLRDDSMPLYHRMLFEIIFGGILASWYEAGDAIARCEAIWHNTNAHHKNATDECIQGSLTEIRQLLDALQRAHAMKPRAMEDPRLAVYEEEWEEEEEEEEEEDDDFGDVVEEYVVDEDWSDEETLMDLGESRDFRYTMEAVLHCQARGRAHPVGRRWRQRSTSCHQGP